jgi:succinoglycan biosynthesis transport protein ExoP
MTNASANRPTTLRDYVAILRRRKWIILTLPVVAAVAAFALSSMQARVYQAHASVLVNRSVGVSTDITGSDPSSFDATRYLSTQASIARAPALATRVASTAGVAGLTAGGVLGISSVAPRTDADVLDFFVSYGNPTDAAQIVNAYAHEFTLYKTEVDTARIHEALRVLRTRLQALQRTGQGASATAQTLTQYQSQLLTADKLVAGSTTVLQPAGGAAQVSPHPKRNLLAAGFLGLVLALGLAFLLESLDRRVRTEDEIASTLGLPLLGRLSAPPRKLQHDNELVMLAEPMTQRAEMFRKLRTSIEFVNREHSARTIMFTSGVQGEGKSTTVANVAVAFARAGRRVALVDFDLRQPILHTFFGVRNSPGITDVIVEREHLSKVVQQIALPLAGSATGEKHSPALSSARWSPSDGSSVRAQSNGRGSSQHVLHFVPCGTIPAIDDDLLEGDRISSTLAALANTFDLVLIDAPPFLAVGDAMALSARVDGMVVVTHFGTQRPVVRELARELDQSQAHVLGFVLTGFSHADGRTYGYGYGYGYGYEAEQGRAEAQATSRRA